MPLKTLEELLRTDEPAWPLVQSWLHAATNHVEVLPASDPERGTALHSTQVTIRSPLGAIIYETGGLLVDHGWLRILGSGHERLPRSAPAWNWGRTVHRSGDRPAWFLIADDAIGGFYALDDGILGFGSAVTCYLAPDTLEWESLDCGYSDFVHWCLTGDLAEYYRELRWEGWEDEVAALRGDQGISIVPWLLLKGPPIGQRSRRPVPIEELFGLHVPNLTH